MKRKRMLSALLVVAMAATMFAGCGNKDNSNSSTQGGKAANDGDIKEFTAFFAVPGSEINDDNEVQQIRGVLGNVEKEIKEHYADNLTLKGLSEKYYVNSAYLGQLFRKKYGQSFKDYLNNYRMDQAVDLLLHSDKKIIQVAEEVGYHDLDYFVNRFIQVKGCTPAKFRKQMQQ